MSLDCLIFDPSACGFPKSRVPFLPRVPSCLSFHTQKDHAWAPAGHFRHYKRGRYALREAYRLAGIGGKGVLLAPSYHCRTMIDPALALGGEVALYPLHQDLSPNLAAFDSLAKNSCTPIRAVLATHFFGIPQNLERLSVWCKERGITLVEDCSHVLFGERYRAQGTGLHGDFVVSSPYKFLPSPDGGLLYARQADQLADVTTQQQPAVQELRGIANAISSARHYRRSARPRNIDSLDNEITALTAGAIQRGRDLRECNTCSADYHLNEEGLKSLRASEFIFRHSDIEELGARRRENYRRWSAGLADTPYCRLLYRQLPDNCVPYMFPLHIENPDPHFFYMKQLGVPIWRWDSIVASQCATANDYRLRLLHLPCHQSLGENDLAWMISAVRKALSQPWPRAGQ